MRLFAVAAVSLFAVSSLACSDTSSSASSPSAEAKNETQKKKEKEAAARMAVTVTEKGYSPARVDATAGKPLTLVFTRTTDKGCGGTLVFPAHNIKKDLPLNKAVEVTITPKAKETISFTCGMGMYKGSVVATKS